MGEYRKKPNKKTRKFTAAALLYPSIRDGGLGLESDRRDRKFTK